MKRCFSRLIIIFFLNISIVTLTGFASGTDKPVLTVSNIDCTSNRLSWSKIKNAKSYAVYLLNEETGRFEKYGETKGTSCTDKKLDPGTKYTYAVSAVFAGGAEGYMSDPVSIYTYSRVGGSVQGNYIYYVCNDPNSTTSVIRTDRNGKNAEKILSYDDLGRVFAGQKHIFYSKSGSFFCADINGKNQRKLCGSSENFSISEVSVYDDLFFYSRFGSFSENGECTYDLFVIDSKGNRAGEYENIYDGIYSSISFVCGENDSFYIAWQSEELDKEAMENSEYGDIITKPTENICMFDCNTKEKILIPYADAKDKRVVKVCGYIDGTVYVKIYGGGFGFISDNGRFVEIELPVNSNHETVNPKNGDVFFEHTEYTDGEMTKKELFCLSGSKRKKIADLYCDQGINMQRYTLCGQYIICTSPDNKKILCDLEHRKKYVLAESFEET